MKWQTAFYFVLLSSVLAAGQLAPAAAEPAGVEYRLPHAAVDTQIAKNGNGKIRGRIVPTGTVPKFVHKLREAHVPVDMSLFTERS